MGTSTTEWKKKTPEELAAARKQNAYALGFLGLATAMCVGVLAVAPPLPAPRQTGASERPAAPVPAAPAVAPVAPSVAEPTPTAVAELPTSAVEPPTPAVRTRHGHYRTKSGFLGALAKDDFELATKFLVQDDRAALTRLVLQRRAFVVPEGLEVMVTETKIFSGVVSIRKVGELESFWTNLEAITPFDAPAQP